MDSEVTDAFLVSAAQAGDKTAFVELNKRHAAKLLPRVYRITKNWQDAEDAVQEAFLKAFVHMRKFEGRSTFSTWLTRIAINSALMMLRKRRVVEISMDGYGNGGDTSQTWELADVGETPESLCAKWQREDLLRSATEHLRPALRKVIQLRQVRDYSTKEIAEELGISVAAAKSRLTRARAALRMKIGRR